MRPIIFGTDGWRGVIADDFTYDRVAVVGEAIGEYLREEGSAARGVIIGYDNRFASEAFARVVAGALARQGIGVTLSDARIPTPVLSYAIADRQCGGGVMITASHNPAPYNGVKFKPWFGGSASPEATHAIAERANALLESADVDALRAQTPDTAQLPRVDLITPYLARIRQFIDEDTIRAGHPRVIVDSLYGSSQGVLDRALREVGCAVEVIHGEYNPSFGGLHPEPIDTQLGPLMAAVRAAKVDGAVASDGDGDRLGAVAEDGAYVSPHHLFALLLIHLVEDRGLRGGVVKTVSTTTMIDKLAKRYDLPLYETPIGFKYIAELMMAEEILIGGEESGGIGVAGHIPERDATLAALYLVEMMAMRGATLGGLLAQLRELVGRYEYDRIDLRLRQTVTEAEMHELRRLAPAEIAGSRVRDISARDGVKFWCADGSWLLLRASGTEPVLRIYAESATRDGVRALLAAGGALANRAGIATAEAPATNCRGMAA